MDWASNFSIVTSEKSGAEDGNGVEAKCADTHTLLGCACLPADAPNNGCKHTQIQDEACLATNMKEHKAGVKAQALCAILPNSSNWESVTTGDHVVDKSTNLACSKPFPELQMISCSCGSSEGQCNGGKTMANKCECFGKRCFATGRCANIPTPPRDCIWMNWGEWSDCTVTCGKGTQSRVREIAMLATDGGVACDGPTFMNASCLGDASKSECNNTKAADVVVPSGGSFTLLIILFAVIVLTICGGGVINHQYQKMQNAALESAAGAMGWNGQDYGGGGYEGEGYGGGGEGAGADAWSFGAGGGGQGTW